MTNDTTSAAFGNSAFLAHLHSVVPATETEPFIAMMLSALGEDDPAIAGTLSSIAMRRDAFLQLTFWSERLFGPGRRDRLRGEALKFWAAQTLVTTSLRPTVFEPAQVYHPAVARALEKGAEGLSRSACRNSTHWSHSEWIWSIGWPEGRLGASR